MKKLFLLVVVFLLSIGLIATLNGSEYIGLYGILDRLSYIDFSFSDTIQVATEMFDSFKNVGTDVTLWQKVESAVRGVFDLVRVPFEAIKELLKLLADIFDLLFTLIGVF